VTFKFLLVTPITVYRGVPLLNVHLLVNPLIQDCKIWPPETRNIYIILSYDVKCILNHLGINHECNKQTDRQTNIANVALHYTARPKWNNDCITTKENSVINCCCMIKVRSESSLAGRGDW